MNKVNTSNNNSSAHPQETSSLKNNSNNNLSQVISADEKSNYIHENSDQGIKKRKKYLKAMAHDFKTPLQILRLNMQMEILENGNSMYKREIDKQLKSFEKVIMRYLMAEEDSFFERAQPELIDLKKYFLQQKLKYKQLDYHLQIKSIADDKYIWADEYMFNKIISNVIDNGLNHGAEDKMIIKLESNTICLSNKINANSVIGDIFSSERITNFDSRNQLGVEIINTYINILGWKVCSEVIGQEFVVRIEMKNKHFNST